MNHQIDQMAIICKDDEVDFETEHEIDIQRDMMQNCHACAIVYYV